MSKEKVSCLDCKFNVNENMEVCNGGESRDPFTGLRHGETVNKIEANKNGECPFFEKAGFKILNNG